MVILCHPAVIGQDYLPLVELAEILYPYFDIVTFDFRGHGKSGGYCSLSLMEPVIDLRGVIHHFREKGYAWIGVVGFSLGGIAAILYASRWKDVDAVVSIGVPPRLPEFQKMVGFPRLASWLLRPLGLRISPSGVPIVHPLEAVPHVSPIPLFLVHGELEITYPREEFEKMWAQAREPKERLVVQAGHAELGDGGPHVLEWLLSLLQPPPHTC